MFELLNHVTAMVARAIDTPGLWPLVFVMAGLDAVLPFMPSEATVIAVAVLLDGQPVKLGLLALVAALGSAAGDTLGFAVGRGPGARVLRRLQSRAAGQGVYAWIRRAVRRHATAIIIAGRYLPGGRVALVLATGGLGYPLRGFLWRELIGASIWGVQAVLVGWIGGTVFSGRPFFGLLLAFALVLTVLGVIELVRRRLTGRGAFTDAADDASQEATGAEEASTAEAPGS